MCVLGDCQISILASLTCAQGEYLSYPGETLIVIKYVSPQRKRNKILETAESEMSLVKELNVTLIKRIEFVYSCRVSKDIFMPLILIILAGLGLCFA